MDEARYFCVVSFRSALCGSYGAICTHRVFSQDKKYRLQVKSGITPLGIVEEVDLLAKYSGIGVALVV